jgi:hypothetical protein
MIIVPTPPPAAEYQPTAAQKKRAAALRRFNWLYFYLPILLFTIGGTAIVVLLLWSSLPAERDQQRLFVSGLADLILILTIAPLLLLCAIMPGAALFLVVRARREGQAPIRRLQTLLWRLETLLAKISSRITETGNQTAHKVIHAHSRMAWLRQLVRSLPEQIKQFLRRER